MENSSAAGNDQLFAQQGNMEPANMDHSSAADTPSDKKRNKKKKSKLKKAGIITAIIAGSLVLLFLLLAIFISPIAHHVIEKHSKEICHRIVTMEDLKINLFKGTVDISGFKALEEDDKTTFLTFNRLYCDISLWKLISRTVQLNEITLRNPNTTIIQNGKRFNFTDIIEFYTKDKKKKKEEKKESSWVVDLRNISLHSGNIVYKDAQVKSEFDLRDLSVSIPRIYFSTRQTNVGLNLKFADGGLLNLKLLYSLKKNTYDLSIDLRNFALSSISPYLRQFLNINQFGGSLTTRLQLNGNLDHILYVIAQGNVSISNLYATDTHNKQLARVDKLNIPIKKVDIRNNQYQFGAVTFTGITTQYDVYKDSHSFDNLVRKRGNTSGNASTADTNSTTKKSEPVSLSIDRISIKNSNITYNDHTMRKPLSIPITGLNADVENFALNRPLNVKLRAIVGDGGQLQADWRGSLNDLYNQDITLSLKNIKMNMTSPYCYEYLAYAIEDGVLSFVSRTTIANQKLNSQNKIDIYNCRVSKKDKSFKPEFNIPLRAGLYVLADRKGRIQLDLPVTGDLSSPNFSYRKIIFKAIGNLFVKVLAAPIDFIVQAVGGDPDVFADIEYEIHPQGLGSESYDKLNKIAEVMKIKSEMKLTLQQSIDKEENIQEYALFRAKRDYYMQKHNKEQLTMEDFAAISDIKNTDTRFVKYVENRAEGRNGMTDIKALCVALYDRAEIEAQIDANLEKRKQQIIQHFAAQGIDARRLVFLELGTKKTPKGKTLLSFGAEFDEDEMNLE